MRDWEQVEFTAASIIRLLGYRSHGSLVWAGFPPPDSFDYYGGKRRWYAHTVARWLRNNPEMLERVSDHEDILKIV